MSEMEGSQGQVTSSETNPSTANTGAPQESTQQSSGVTTPNTSNPAAKTAPGTPPAPVVAAPSPWAPNWKFKAAGKEHEIPEYLRAVVKDAATEKQLKELHERAYGLDLVKSNYQNAQQQLSNIQKTIMPEYDSLKKTVSSVIMFRNNNDLDAVFESVGIPQQAIAQWMYNKLQMQDLDPQQRAVYENEIKLKRQNYALQERVQNLSQTQQQSLLQTKAGELQAALGKPEVTAMAEAYNTRMAQPDAFWNFVCQQADYMERTSGQQVSAEQAVQQTLRILGNSSVAQPTQAGATNPAPTGNQTPPVIPNVQGARNSSPTKKVARSLDDLRKLAKEMAGKTA